MSEPIRELSRIMVGTCISVDDLLKSKFERELKLRLVEELAGAIATPLEVAKDTREERNLFYYTVI